MRLLGPQPKGDGPGDPVDPLEALKALKKLRVAGHGVPEPDPLDQLKASKKPGNARLHAEYASGALEQRMTAANERDVANAAENTNVVSPAAGMAHSVAATGANIAAGIPGMEMTQSGARSLVRGQPYGEALTDIRGQTGKIPLLLRIGERVAGAAPLARILPGSPVAAGAVMGAADQALSADPGQTLAGRATRTAVGGVTGAAFGKAADMAVTGARMAIAQSPAANVLARKTSQALVAAQLYGASLKQGAGRVATKAVEKFLAQPDIADIVSGLQQTRPFKGVAAHEPEMLDAVYKTLTDHARQIERGLAVPTPNRPNVGRFNLQDTKAAQGELLEAMKGSAAEPGPMPGYPVAVKDFAQRSAQIEGVKRGSDAIRSAFGKSIPQSSTLTRTTPEALRQWATTAPDAVRSAAGEGVLGAAKGAASRGPLKLLKAVNKSGKVLRDINVPSQATVDYLIRLGLVSATAATP